MTVQHAARRVAVVTGANRGIGRALALGLARAGHHVVLACRRAADGEDAGRFIQAQVPAASLEVATVDLASLSSVRAFASALLESHPRIDVLVNNAAVALKRREDTVDGIEKTLAVNHLAPFALTVWLLPALRRAGTSGGARVVTVSSGSQHNRRLDLGDLQNRRRYAGVRAYGETKLMNVLFTRELARRGRAHGISAFSMHPGVIGTNLLLDYLPLQALLRPLVRRFSGTPEEGADTGVWLATHPGLEASSGGYFIRRAPARPNPLANDEALARALWEESARLTGADWPA